jgi:hypothetical protein
MQMAGNNDKVQSSDGGYTNLKTSTTMVTTVTGKQNRNVLMT